MTQDLIDWLNSTHSDTEKELAGAAGGLLLAPVVNALTESPEAQDEPESQEPAQEVLPEPENTPPAQEQPRQLIAVQPKITALNDAWHAASPEESADDESALPEPEEPAADELTLDEPEEPAADEPAFPEPEEPASDSEILPEPQNEPSADADSDDHRNSILNQAWHEAAGVHINLNEPPSQMWTDIDEDEEDDEPKDYEETSSLQGDAYIPVVKHGANFTQRLQATLKSRKDKAAKQKAHDAENSNLHPYIQKSIIFCGVLLMTLGFVYFGLWFISRETPEKLNERANSLYAEGKFDEAANLYQRGWRNYPSVLTFLTGIAKSAEKAGRTQTAITAWNEYISSLPEESSDQRREAQQELERLIPGGTAKPEQKAPTPPPVTQRTITLPVKPAPAKPDKPALPDVRPMTFDEALREANSAFNIGMFSRAISNFHKAHAIRENDIRPYIGLAAGYRAKGLFFEARRILDEARQKFGRHPSLETERYFLRRE